jgi:cell filamentation protein
LPDPEDLRDQARALLDPYVDPFWQILRNKVHARTASELARAETDLVWSRAVELVERPPAGRCDLAHLRGIHRHLFQDVYPFAGQLRTVDLRKADDPAGWFRPAAGLPEAAEGIFAALTQDKHLRGVGRGEFVTGLARHLDAVNNLHPFREGNGRTQRIFFSQLSARAGYLLHWNRIGVQENITASRAGAAAWPPLLDRITEPFPRRTRGDQRETTAVRAVIQALAARVDEIPRPSETPAPEGPPVGWDEHRRPDRGTGPRLHP